MKTKLLGKKTLQPEFHFNKSETDGSKCTKRRCLLAQGTSMAHARSRRTLCYFVHYKTQTRL